LGVDGSRSFAFDPSRYPIYQGPFDPRWITPVKSTFPNIPCSVSTAPVSIEVLGDHTNHGATDIGCRADTAPSILSPVAQ
jgi:hypothetical protein